MSAAEWSYHQPSSLDLKKRVDRLDTAALILYLWVPLFVGGIFVALKVSEVGGFLMILFAVPLYLAGAIVWMRRMYLKARLDRRGAWGRFWRVFFAPLSYMFMWMKIFEYMP